MWREAEVILIHNDTTMTVELLLMKFLLTGQEAVGMMMVWTL